MDVYSQLKTQIITAINETKGIISDLKDIKEIKTTSLENWHNTCDGIQAQIEEEIIRIAVVGAIKSGKSTVANSIIGGDLLKRGAGVVTSIVTRIRKGDTKKARIRLKSWETVNNDILQAMVLFPSPSFNPNGEIFDIRNDNDRKVIRDELSTLDSDLLISTETRNENTVLLNNYLNGYEKISKLKNENSNLITYREENFFEHGSFTGNDTYATYVEDIELEVNSKNLDTNVELADCQGSDSPNPIHLAQVQDYLLKTHLILYVVSSRTGLRRADIKFLKMIKEMGIIENILFVLNVDLNEHETLDDLKRIKESVVNDIELIKSRPELFTFSALNRLYKTENILLSEKDTQIHEIWLKDQPFNNFTDDQYASFNDALRYFINQKRYTLLLKNHVERLYILENNLSQFISLNREIMRDDSVNRNQMNENIKIHQKKIAETRKLIQNTFSGSVQKLKKELKSDIDSFFDDKYGDVITEVVQYITNYQFDYSKYHETFTEDGFSNTLYIVFQEFKQSLNTHMTEKTTPQIIKFVKTMETKITEFLMSIAKPFDLIVKEKIEDYQASMNEIGFSMNMQTSNHSLKDIELIKREAGIFLPKAVTITSYTKLIQTDAIIRFGVYSIAAFFKSIFNRKDKKKDAARALKDSIKRIKKETIRSVKFNFLDYKENLKFKYIFALIDKMVDDLFNSLDDSFHNYVEDLTEISMAIKDNAVDKDQLGTKLESIQIKATNLKSRMGEIRKKIEGTLH